MSSIVVRGLDEAVKRRLALQAQRHGRSMEAEVREVLSLATQRQNLGLALLELSQGPRRLRRPCAAPPAVTRHER
ncbi:hypothetical protein AAEX63_08685 [Luteococcus sp. H138]|uniref:FitA-like ribbon-helix-helix domain-containing protein n=1 Tax=unclassified Luteococcus TaxID=2639923 RepID=UPI00313C0AAB